MTVSVPVDLAAVCDSGHKHEAGAVVDRVDDAIVADTDPVVAAAGELDGAVRTGVIGEGVNCGANPILERSPEATVSLRGLPMQPNVVAGGYSRTSYQETVSSASSRAWSAARLSSRYSRRSTSSA